MMDRRVLALYLIMDSMKETYLRFLNDSALWKQLMFIITDMQPDGSKAALFFLEYPQQVMRAETRQACPNIRDSFRLLEFVQCIASKTDLLKFCRTALS